VIALMREALVTHLMALPKVVDRYVQGDAGFADHVQSWLGEAQGTMERFRSPLASLVAIGRSSIQAIADGASSPNLAGRSSSSRKARRATAAAVLARVDDALRAKVAELDAQLNAGSERIAQMLAVANGQIDLKRPEGEVPRTWYRSLWSQLGQIQDLRDAHVFISASFGASDRIYLLERILDRMAT